MDTTDTLKHAFLEFINKLNPLLPDQLLSIVSDFKEQLWSKTPTDLYEFVQQIPELKKSNSSCNTSPEPLLNKVPSHGYNPLSVCSQKESDDKSQSSYSAEKYQQLKIEINKNFFLKPTTKFNSNTQNKSSKNVDIEAKVQRENIKLVETLKDMPKLKRICFAERTGLLNQVSEALHQFKKDGITINTVYEKSTEISTPQTPIDTRTGLQQCYYVKQQDQQQFQPFPQQPVCQFKGYSVHSKRGFMQPIQFDMQFQLMQQQFQNQLIYKKLYF
ncbi:unnamed protein product (macronuclear) [Paramecium tetraurelia]|uniref:Uncharacterized protein n=1 Tax=Paramecium tetraurelia TaxID=5888 RepID=A0D845_PARTE|nr:uncharacterized protein GSPATT00014179001 [Paramecium tetraurelia]CAK79212.1 unnamed protein product [Paramecium tetraurelia]|eukprot:XP_001446609.1 hypothetical protein (macronuclear) [Paramecium tetraurelia strain d4-2]